MDPPPAMRTSTRTWWGLGALLLPALLTSMDASILFVAGPTLAEDLRLSPSQWLWAMDLYGLVMAGLLIVMGNLGDRFGRRRLLLIGSAAFGVASMLLAFAPNAEVLILGRGVLAVGGATLAPSTLSLIRDMFPDEDQRRIALSAWTVAFTSGAVGGPIVGGALLDNFWWGSVFLMNVPLMVLLLITAPFLVPESAPRPNARLDLIGVLALMLAIVATLFALNTVVDDERARATVITVAASALVAVCAGAFFLVRQRRTPDPLVDLALFRSWMYSAGIGVNTTVALVTGGVGVLVFPFLQTVHGLSPFRSAICGLPPMLGSFLGAAAAARVARRYPTRSLAGAGLLVTAVGTGLLALTHVHTSLAYFLATYTIVIFGCGGAATLANSLILSHAPAERSGAAAGVSETSNQLGTAVGIAALGAVASLVYRHQMTSAPKAVATGADQSISAALAVARQLTEGQAAALLGHAYEAYTHGLAAAAIVGAVTATILGAALTLARMPRRKGDRASQIGRSESRTADPAGQRRTAPGP